MMQEPQKPTPPADFHGDVELKLTALKYSSLVYLRNGRSVLWDASFTPARPLTNVRLCVEYTPDYVEKTEIVIPFMEAGKTFVFRYPAAPRYDENRLLALDEEERGCLRVSLTDAEGELLAAEECSFVWLAHNAWAGGFEFPELLAALTLPEDAAVDKLLADTQKRLASAGKPMEWVGYTGKGYDYGPQLLALWETLASYNIRYALPPASWRDDGVGQRVRTPSQILSGGCSTCLDSSLLLAAAVSRMGLNPVVILIAGHAFLGVWLTPESLPHPHETAVATVRNRVKQGDILLLETTAVNGVESRAPAPFEVAAAAGYAKLERLTDEDYFLALDLRMLWHECGIRPILGGTGSQYVAAAAVADDLVTARPQGRMDNWQLKLLDMSLRNNLLSCKPDGRRQLGLLPGDVAALEDELSKGAAFRIRPLPQTEWNDVAGAAKGKADDAARARLNECVNSMFRKHELPAVHTESELQHCLQGIYGSTRREMEESGANTLYLACGFLKWYRKGAADKAYYAPILLIPVRLTRPAVRAGYTLRGGDEETRVNMTLLEFLRTEYELQIPELEGDLPADDSGLDVDAIFNIVRRAVSVLPGWEVDERCILGSFSFTKYLMWKDLVDRRKDLLNNAIVSQIAAEHRGTFPDQGGFPDPKNLDNDVDAEKVFTPMSADSSQLSAVLAAARGKSFVLIGPPGTGKSQTITNMIAHCLGHGKTVLFVAEKSAALQVVHNRLKRIGLEDFCLELHSHKANKKDALEQFRSAVEAVNGGTKTDRWEENVYSMANLRYRLNLLPWEMHRNYPDGGSLFGDVSLLAAHEATEVPALVQEDALTLTRERRQELLETARELVRYFRLAEAAPAEVVQACGMTECTAAAEQELAAALRQYAADSRAVQSAADALSAALQPLAERPQMQSLYPVLRLWAEQPAMVSNAFFPSRAAKAQEHLQTLAAHAQRCRELRAALTLPYPDSTLAEPMLDSWLRECRELAVSGFFTRWFGMRRMARVLKGQALSTAKPDCLKDLTNLVALREELKALRGVDVSLLPPALNKGEATGGAETEAAAAAAAQQAALSPADEKTLERLLADTVYLPADTNAVGRAVKALAAACDAAELRRSTLARLLARPVCALQTEGQGAEWAEQLLQHHEQWRDIALWNRMAETARGKGCGAMAEALASRTVPAAQLETAVALHLARTRVPAAADAAEVLRDFAPKVHESRIAEFGQKDAALMKKTTEHIRTLLTQRASEIAKFGTETSLLQHELSKQRGHMPLRRLLSSLPNVTPLLKPCLLMSPLSVAQYLATDAAPFDVVIFDEASQIPVWDAIGVIGRGKSAVVVGDPRQMPPTSFFSRSKTAEEDEYAAVEADMESILDECIACGIPVMNLSWHYRSKSESLIAFSNKKYYEDKLVTFPAPVMQDKALTYHHTGGVYESGANKRVNREEARQLVAHVIATLKAEGFRYTEATSIGIVTFNSQQQALIEDMLEEARAKDETLEPFFSEDNAEAVFVKNLENVQGDERGVIYFSTTYGRDAQGKMSMNFGPLNLSGGERRLNVAITRARCGMHVFTSMAPEDISLSRTNAKGAADLHDFLDYARRGAAAYLTTAAATAEQGQLAACLAKHLQERGWKCRASVGVSGYRIDLAVEHPDAEGETLAGIMLDGKAYADSNTARDRDVLRPSVLSGLGWRLIRVWAIDWWRHPKTVVAQVDALLTEYRKMGPPVPPVLPELVGAAAPAAQERPAPVAERRPAEQAPLPQAPEYKAYSPAKLLPPLFEMNDSTLCRLIKDFVSAEGPVTQEHLMKSLPAFCTAGSVSPKQKQHLHELVTHLLAKGELQNNPEPVGDGTYRRILTRAGQPLVHTREGGTRHWTDVPQAEWLEGARTVRAHLGCLPGCDDHIKAVATYFGYGRVTKQMKEFLADLMRNNAGDMM